MGPEEFRRGITSFLNRFKFANAVTQDLWDELQGASQDFNMTRVMDSWTRQVGYPVVSAHRTTNSTVTLVQHVFMSDPREDPANDKYVHRHSSQSNYVASETHKFNAKNPYLKPKGFNFSYQHIFLDLQDSKLYTF